MIENISLNDPLWLLLSPALFIIQLLFSRFAQGTDEIGLGQHLNSPARHVRHPYIHLLVASNQQQQAISLANRLLLWCVLVSLSVALSGPVRIGEKLPDPPRERDIVFIVDTSVSMTLRDYVLDGQRVDRMSVVRAMLDKFFLGLQGDRSSIIVFADNTHVMVPLSSDHSLLRTMLPRIRPGIAGRSNAIGEAIALAVKQADKTPQRHRVLVLISDAALPVGSITPKQAAALAKKSGLPLYTIAVGAGSYAAEEQRTTGLIYHPANISLLKSLAELTGAKSYQAGDSTSLESALAEIEQLERNSRELAPRYYRQPLYAWCMIPALVLLTLMQILRLRNRLVAI